MKFEISIISWEKVRNTFTVKGVDYQITQIEDKILYKEPHDFDDFDAMNKFAHRIANELEAMLGKEKPGTVPFVFPKIKLIDNA